MTGACVTVTLALPVAHCTVIVPVRPLESGLGVTEYAIMMLNEDGFVSSWNAGAERIKGYKSAEIPGHGRRKRSAVDRNGLGGRSHDEGAGRQPVPAFGESPPVAHCRPSTGR